MHRRLSYTNEGRRDQKTMRQYVSDDTYGNKIFKVYPLPLSFARGCDGHPLDVAAAAAVVTHLEHGSRDLRVAKLLAPHLRPPTIFASRTLPFKSPGTTD